MTTIEYLTVPQVAKMLGVSESLIRKLVFLDQIPYIRVRSLIRFRESDIHRWVKDQEQKEESRL